jgi:hypothetical protein
MKFHVPIAPSAASCDKSQSRRADPVSAAGNTANATSQKSARVVTTGTAHHVTIAAEHTSSTAKCTVKRSADC